MLSWLLQGSMIQLVLLILFLIMGLCSLAFILSTILIRLHHNRVSRKEKALSEHFDDLFFSYLEDPSNKEVINRIGAIEKSDEFFRYLLHYMQILKGRDHELIKKLIVDIGFPGMLLNSLRQQNRWKRAYAAFALGVLKHEPATTSLLLAYNDDFYLVRYYAIQAIIRIQNPAHIKNAIKALFTVPYISSYQIMECLAELNEDSLETCVEIMNETPPLTEEQMKMFIDLFFYKKYSGAARKVLQVYSQYNDRELRISCIRSLGLLHYTPAVAMLRNLLSEKDWIIRSQAIRSLGRIGDIGSLSEFLEAMKSENFWVSYNAALTLFDLGDVGINYLQKIRDNSAHPGQDIAKQVLFEKKMYVSQPA